MNIHERRHMGPDRRYDIRPDGQVGHEVAVHRIDVNPVCALILDRAYFRAEVCEVRRKDGRRNLDGTVEGHGKILCDESEKSMPDTERQRKLNLHRLHNLRYNNFG